MIMVNMPTHIENELTERNLRIEPATVEDLSVLTTFISDLMEEQPDFVSDEAAHAKGIQLILESPSKGRIFVLRDEEDILGMVNILFTITTALGGCAALMEDVIIHPQYRRQGLGSLMLDYAVAFAEEKDFKRITLLADAQDEKSQSFFQNKGFDFSGLIPMKRILN